MMRIELYRHGRTAGNLHSAYIGVTDEPLCEQGRAELTAIDEGEELVYVTPRLRTRQTAEIMFPHARQVVVDGLAEMDFGAFEGLDYRALEDDRRYRGWVEGGCVAACPGGEDRSGFQKRCVEAFIPVMDEAVAGGVQRVRFVVHGGTIMSLLDEFAVPHRDYFEWHTYPGGHWTLETDDTMWADRTMRLVGEAYPWR